MLELPTAESERKVPLEPVNRMTQLRSAFWILLLASTAAFSQSDEEMLQKVRAGAEKTYLEQVSFTLPESFHQSALAPSDKEKLIERWASDSAICHVEALRAYAAANNVPLSELVSDDGTYGFGVGAPADWEQELKTCLAETWEAIGAEIPSL
jgi:hypothetical protein